MIEILKKEELEELTKFLFSLKEDNWLVDSGDFKTIFNIIEWYERIYGEKIYKEERNMELILAKITSTLCNYVKAMRKGNPFKLCKKCKQFLDTDLFITKTGKKTSGCSSCREKVNSYNGKNREPKEPVIHEGTINCRRCFKEVSNEGYKTCKECMKKLRNYKDKRDARRIQR